nr:hypothetical protein [Clostridium sp.]
MLKIGTINLNGETWHLNRKIPRISRSILDKQKIKQQMTDVLNTQFGKILESKEYDIIAVQELVYISEHYSKIENQINEKGYSLITPEKDILIKNTHFITAFIIKNEIKDKIKPYDNSIENNRFIIIKLLIEDEKEIAILNVHVNSNCEDEGIVSKESIQNVINTIKEEVFGLIILGDFNA